MRRYTLTSFSLPLVLSIALSACSPAPSSPNSNPKADLLLTGATIYSGLSATPDVTAIGIKDGTIICVEPAAPCPAADQFTEVMDLSGAALYPGLTDAHGHLRGIGMREMTLNLEGTPSIVALQDAVRTQIADTPKGELIFGRGWIETHWPEGRFPNAADLDAVSTDHPIILKRADGHAVVVNSAALERAGITADTQPPFGGDILRTNTGAPSGMLIDNAQDLVSAVGNQELSEARKEAAYVKAGEVYAAYGWTGIHFMSSYPEDTQLINRLSDEGKLGLRVYNALDNGPAALKVLETPDLDGKVITRAIKLYSDGALGSRGAALLAPYDDDKGNSGLITLKPEETLELLKHALSKGLQINTHAIGDRGNRLVLDLYEKAFAAVPENERAIAQPRWRIEHAQILSLDDIKRFTKLGVIPSMQPSHAIGDLHFAVDRIGVKRLAGGYSWRSLIDSGVIIPGGTDAPVERGDPRIEYYAATTRKDVNGFSAEGWYPEQKVTRLEGLKMFTQWPAYASFQDQNIGTIEVGKKADFSVFDRDLLTVDSADILTAKVLMTMVEGKTIYTAP